MGRPASLRQTKNLTKGESRLGRSQISKFTSASTHQASGLGRGRPSSHRQALDEYARLEEEIAPPRKLYIPLLILSDRIDRSIDESIPMQPLTAALEATDNVYLSLYPQRVVFVPFVRGE